MKIIQTCSLECVKQHKIEMNCSGKRDATEKVQKKNMGDRMLLSGENYPFFFLKRRDDIFVRRKSDYFD